MNLQINIYQAPWSSRAQVDALAYARAAVAAGHTLRRAFFFMDAVYGGLHTQAPASDEFDLLARWIQLKQDSGCELLLCIAASANRGVLNEVEAERQAKPAATMAPAFELVGLGQWASGFGDCDRVVSF